MKREKKDERILAKPPKRDITSSELDSFLKRNGFVLDRIADNAHFFYKHIATGRTYSFANPHGGLKHVLVSYIVNLQRLLKELEEKQNE